MIDCCGEHRRKFGDLEEWLLRPFIKGLPTVFQVPLLFLPVAVTLYVVSKPPPLRALPGGPW